MAIDNRLKRMSAMNPNCPWRGPLVDAGQAGFVQDSRRAAVVLYSGLLFPVDVPCPYRPRRNVESDAYRVRAEDAAGACRVRVDEAPAAQRTRVDAAESVRRKRIDECI
jgi:hypothetical protein